MDQTAVVTGTSTGIGLAITKELITKGYRVIGSSRTGKSPDFNHEHLSMVALDVSDPRSIDQAQAQIRALTSSISMLINNAGIGPDLGKSEPDLESFEKTMKVNAQGPVFFSEAMIPMIRKNGILVNISSKMGSVTACDRHHSLAYCMSKTALNMYSKQLANRLQGIVRVANLHPGWVQTPINNYSKNAPLTAKEAGTRIMKFLESDFKHGVFWDVEDWVELPW